MKHSDFVVGQEFWTGARKWRCTDVCSQFIAAIELRYGDDPSEYIGPPYKVPDYAFGHAHITKCQKRPSPQGLGKWRAVKKERLRYSVLNLKAKPGKLKPSPVLEAMPTPEGMQHKDFAIGDVFVMSAHLMRCLDLGELVIIAEDICHADERVSESKGQPYSHVRALDEYDLGACTALYSVSYEVMPWLRCHGTGGILKRIQAVMEASMAQDPQKAVRDLRTLRIPSELNHKDLKALRRAFWGRWVRGKPLPKKEVTLKLDAEVADWLQSTQAPNHTANHFLKLVKRDLWDKELREKKPESGNTDNAD
jgi:uncharacterized protein (DUF4415 family)